MYLIVFTRMPGGVTVGDSGLCCCVPCLWSGTDFPLFEERKHFFFLNIPLVECMYLVFTRMADELP